MVTADKLPDDDESWKFAKPNTRDVIDELDGCFCENIEYQTYAHVVGMKKPFKEGWEGDIVPIDVCIATEIAELWHKGVVTLNSCCGHQKTDSNVIVDDENLKKMQALGYEEYYLAPSGLPCVKLKTGFTAKSKVKSKGDKE